MCHWLSWVGKMPPSYLQQLAPALEGHTNLDASGFGLYRRGGRLQVLKMPIPATSLVPLARVWLEEYPQGAEVGMFHARNATHGTPLNPMNNHPHYTKAGSMLVHQGIVFPKRRFMGDGECDSEQILLSLEHLGLYGGIENCPGSMAISYLPSDGKGLYLYSNSGINTWQGAGLTLFTTLRLEGGTQLKMGQVFRFDLKEQKLQALKHVQADWSRGSMLPWNPLDGLLGVRDETYHESW